MPGESHQPEDSEPHEHVMIPALNYRRPDELSDFHLMYVLDLVADQMQERGIHPAEITRQRAALYRAIDTPSDATWDAVYQARIWKPGIEEPAYLWSLVLAYTSYSITEHKIGNKWEAVPSGGQLFLALAEYFGAQKAATEF